MKLSLITPALFILAACSAPVDPLLTETAAPAPACVADGARYPACDGPAHPFAERWTTKSGSIVTCLADTQSLPQYCQAGDACEVFFGDGGILKGSCQ